MRGFDLSKIEALYVGSIPYMAIYKGSSLIWSSETPPQPGEDYIRVSTKSLSFNSSADQQTFTVSSNVSWRIDVTGGSSWVTVDPQTHTSVGEDETTVTVKTTENVSTSSRQATIQVSHGTIIETLTVTQQKGSSNPYYGWPVMPFTRRVSPIYTMVMENDFTKLDDSSPELVYIGEDYDCFYVYAHRLGDAYNVKVYFDEGWTFYGHVKSDYVDSTTNNARTDTVFYNNNYGHYFAYQDHGGYKTLDDLGTTDPTI